MTVNTTCEYENYYYEIMRYLVDLLQQLCPVTRIMSIIRIQWNTTLMRSSHYCGRFILTGTKAQSVSFFLIKEPP